MRRLLASINRPKSAWLAKCRIVEIPVAYARCAIAATAIVAAIGAVFIPGTAIYAGDLDDLDPVRFIVAGILAWIGLTIGGFIVAWPFLAASTWLGKRLGLESLYFYIGTGLLSSAVTAWAVVGPPRPPDPASFGWDDGRLHWLVICACGASWGACWWHLHRRWATEPQS